MFKYCWVRTLWEITKLLGHRGLGAHEEPALATPRNINAKMSAKILGVEISLLYQQSAI